MIRRHQLLWLLSRLISVENSYIYLQNPSKIPALQHFNKIFKTLQDTCSFPSTFATSMISNDQIRGNKKKKPSVKCFDFSYSLIYRCAHEKKSHLRSIEKRIYISSLQCLIFHLREVKELACMINPLKLWYYSCSHF